MNIPLLLCARPADSYSIPSYLQIHTPRTTRGNKTDLQSDDIENLIIELSSYNQQVADYLLNPSTDRHHKIETILTNATNTKVALMKQWYL